MVIWSGHGYIVFILWVVAALFSAIIKLEVADGSNQSILQYLLAGLFMACSVGVWIWGRGAHARTKRDEFTERFLADQSIDSRTKEVGNFVPGLPQRHSLYFMPVEYWGVAGIALPVAITALRWLK
ncbi:MAG: hypothetical protein MI757_09865 [Pirellulales bacterium]|nr:hypothetical protein [Pirellulales bacterium]